MKPSLIKSKKSIVTAISVAILALALTACGDLKHTKRSQEKLNASAPDAPGKVVDADAAKILAVKKAADEKAAAEKAKAGTPDKAAVVKCDLESLKISDAGDNTSDFLPVVGALLDAEAKTGLNYELDTSARIMVSVSTEDGSKSQLVSLRGTSAISECEVIPADGIGLGSLAEKSSFTISKALVKIDGSDITGITQLKISRAKDAKITDVKASEVPSTTLEAAKQIFAKAELIVGSNEKKERDVNGVKKVVGTSVSRSKDGKFLEIRTISLEKEGDVKLKIVTRIVLKQIDGTQAVK